MITYSCDCCGTNIDDRMYELKLLKHITEPLNIVNGHSKIIDGRFEPCSGVHKNFDLCLTCYNKIQYKTFETFNELKNNHNVNKFKDIPPPEPPEDRVFYEGERIPKPKRLKK